MSKRQKWQMVKRVTLQKCWVWEQPVVDFVRERITGYSLNVCAGQNPICAVNLDLDPADRSIIKGDMRLLPFPSNSFDTVVSDPPWKMSYYERLRPFFECVRVCRVGGTIIYNATWIPMCPSGDVELLETWLRHDGNFMNTSVISIFRKLRDNPEYNFAREQELAANQPSQEAA